MKEIMAFEDKFENFKPASAPADRTGAMNAMQTQNLDAKQQANTPIIITPTTVTTTNSSSGDTHVHTGNGATDSKHIGSRNSN